MHFSSLLFAVPPTGRTVNHLVALANEIWEVSITSGQKVYTCLPPPFPCTSKTSDVSDSGCSIKPEPRHNGQGV